MSNRNKKSKGKILEKVNLTEKLLRTYYEDNNKSLSIDNMPKDSCCTFRAFVDFDGEGDFLKYKIIGRNSLLEKLEEGIITILRLKGGLIKENSTLVLDINIDYSKNHESLVGENDDTQKFSNFNAKTGEYIYVSGAIYNDKTAEFKPVYGIDEPSEVLTDSSVDPLDVEYPQFPGGINAFKKYKKKLSSILMNVKKPLESITISYTVDRNGSINNAHVDCYFNTPVDEKILKWVYSMPKWLPGKVNGHCVNFNKSSIVWVFTNHDKKRF